MARQLVRSMSSSESVGPVRLLDLPDETIFTILARTQPSGKEAVDLSLVCKRFKSLIDSADGWRAVCLAEELWPHRKHVYRDRNLGSAPAIAIHSTMDSDTEDPSEPTGPSGQFVWSRRLQPEPMDWREFYRAEKARLRREVEERDSEQRVATARQRVLNSGLYVVTFVLPLWLEALLLWLAWLPAKLDGRFAFSWMLVDLPLWVFLGLPPVLTAGGAIVLSCRCVASDLRVLRTTYILALLVSVLIGGPLAAAAIMMGLRADGSITVSWLGCVSPLLPVLGVAAVALAVAAVLSSKQEPLVSLLTAVGSAAAALVAVWIGLAAAWREGGTSWGAVLAGTPLWLAFGLFSVALAGYGLRKYSKGNTPTACSAFLVAGAVPIVSAVLWLPALLLSLRADGTLTTSAFACWAPMYVLLGVLQIGVVVMFIKNVKEVCARR